MRKHAETRRLFIRFLGFIYLSAFLSLWPQVLGLYGSQGILPAAEFLDLVRSHASGPRWAVFPTLFWLGSSDFFLRFLCGAGIAASILLIAGIAPALVLSLLWLIYLSFFTVGREFLSFQWDILLLETGFLAIFLAPFSWRLGSGEPSRIMVWLFRWLAFRFFLLSGWCKLASGDPHWRDLTALTFHYQTQPLPPWTAWFANQLPAGFQKFSVAIVFVIELAVPFLIFISRRPRIFACACLVVFQGLIVLTGNYAFFNWLSMALCVWLLDDDALPKFLKMGKNNISRESAENLGRIRPQGRTDSPSPCGEWPKWVVIPAAALVFSLSVFKTAESFLQRRCPVPLASLMRVTAPFCWTNSYGLFAVMTTSRMEIVVEGSDDRVTWRPYEFRYKPGDPMRRPAFVAPHQPRLDWQMWFAALGDFRQNPWFIHFCKRLLEGSKAVEGLLLKNPFPDRPPRYIRAVFYEYRFSTPAERKATRAWWVREERGLYCPMMRLEL